jgi:ATP-dependent DNA helicase Q4
VTCENEASVRGDIRSFIHLYSAEHNLTGRSIARVFHGIGSPNFPADVWGKVRKFWRSHLSVDFNVLRRLATQELVFMK